MNAFYPKALKKDYIVAGTWPDDLIEVTNEIYHEYGDGFVPENKVRIAGENELPIWGTISIDYASKAETGRQHLLSVASTVTADWMTDLQLGIISDEDKASLILWRTYIRQLKELDLSAVTDEESYNGIVWPDKP